MKDLLVSFLFLALLFFTSCSKFGPASSVTVDSSAKGSVSLSLQKQAIPSGI